MLKEWAPYHLKIRSDGSRWTLIFQKTTFVSLLRTVFSPRTFKQCASSSCPDPPHLLIKNSKGWTKRKVEINICDKVNYQECFASLNSFLFEWTSNAQGTSSNQQTKTSWEATSNINPNLRKYTLVWFILSPRNDATEWIMLILVGSRVAKQQGRERCGFWRDAAAIPMRMMRFSPLVAHFIRRRNSAKRSSLETSSKLAIASLALSLDCYCSLRKQIESKAWESFSHLSRFRDCVLLAPLTTSSPCSPSRSRHVNRELITGNQWRKYLLPIQDLQRLNGEGAWAPNAIDIEHFFKAH